MTDKDIAITLVDIGEVGGATAINRRALRRLTRETISVALHADDLLAGFGIRGLRVDGVKALCRYCAARCHVDVIGRSHVATLIC